MTAMVNGDGYIIEPSSSISSRLYYNRVDAEDIDSTDRTIFCNHGWYGILRLPPLLASSLLTVALNVFSCNLRHLDVNTVML